MLDPRRIGLNAADIGFQKRMHQDLDFNAIEVALQTDYNNQGSAIQVRRERESAKDEIHIMGGELAGFQSNDLVKTLARQDRQINGYPLRHFDAQNPAVILPVKYGGFPLYNRNQTEYSDFVSVFTEPMSAPLQRDTELLSRMGKTPISNSLTKPFEEDGYMNPMNKTYDQLQSNKAEFVQRKHLQRMSDRSNNNRSSNNVPNGPNFNVPGGEKGIFINKNGDPMSTVQEELSGQIVANNTFANGQLNYLRRQAGFQNAGNIEFNQILMDGAGSLRQEGNDDHAMFTPDNRLQMPSLAEMLRRDSVVSHDQGQSFFFGSGDEGVVGYLGDNAYGATPNIRTQLAMSNPNLTVQPVGGMGNGMQPMGLFQESGFKLGTVPGTEEYRIKTKAGVPYKKIAPGFKAWLKAKESADYREVQKMQPSSANKKLGLIHASAAKRRENKSKPGSITTYRKPTVTPFKQKTASMLDYGTPTNKSVATPKAGRY